MKNTQTWDVIGRGNPPVYCLAEIPKGHLVQVENAHFRWLASPASLPSLAEECAIPLSAVRFMADLGVPASWSIAWLYQYFVEGLSANLLTKTTDQLIHEAFMHALYLTRMRG